MVVVLGVQMKQKERTKTLMMILILEHTLVSMVYTKIFQRFNSLSAKLFNLNFHPLEVVSRWRDQQLQVSENYSDLTKWRSTLFKFVLVDVTFYL